MARQIIPIFYACDNAFVKYTIVSLKSIIANASNKYRYDVHVLHTDISKEMMARVRELENESFTISFDDVSERLTAISEKLPIRDYYSKTTYFRLFIADMFPEYDKALYIDSDTVITGDISELYTTDIGDCYVGACHEQAMVQIDVYGTYAEQVVGVSRHNFFNAGVLIINCKRYRQKNLLERFTMYLRAYNFVVTQDEDYLNLICKDHVYWLDQRWNTEVFCEVNYPIEEAKLLHYIMTAKPWHYKDCKHGDIFWRYARETSVYQEILDELNGYTDEQRANDVKTLENLQALAARETAREDNFLRRTMKNRDQGRVEIIQKIEEYERDGRFDEDVEADPPSTVLMPDDIDYLKKGLVKRIKSKIAYKTARRFVFNLIKNKKMIVKEIRGIENFRDLECGAVITCNHFNAFDSFAIQIAYEAAEQEHRTFYRIIREGNYTSFPGFYGFLMRNCNTLPLSSNAKTMRKFMDATNTVLRDGHFVLVYPEQSMWWNYRKPKPLKDGAYFFAAKNGVPVLPCFITMKDSDVMDDDGFYVQEYTIHIDKPIYPDETLSHRENVRNMMAENSRVWREIYESEYGMPLVYTTAEGVAT